jgi:hypothetical protein
MTRLYDKNMNSHNFNTQPVASSISPLSRIPSLLTNTNKMSDPNDEVQKELLRIARKAETVMQDPDKLLNTDLELEKFDQFSSKIIASIDAIQEERAEIITKEDELRRELQQLVDEEKELKSALKSIRIYKPKYPKRYKVMLFSL